MAEISTDYLIIGAGASGLAFADELLTQTDAHMTLIDTRPEPGGHWNDAYPFVRLHQPSAFYGVGSRPLGDQSIDRDGPNAGYLSLASGGQVMGHFHGCLYERLIPSGRVQFLPMHRANRDGTVTSLVSGDVRKVNVRRKTVNAAYMTNAVPKTHKRGFDVADGVHCIPPNDLPGLSGEFAHFTVLGGGKTGMDTVNWLLGHGVHEQQIRWVVPRDSWLWNRATTQPDDAFFETVYGSFLDRQKAIAEASNPRDMALRFEASGMWMRLDPDVEPTVYRGATVTSHELDMLRSVRDKVRLGRVTRIERGALVLEQGKLAAPDETLYVDCSAKPFASGTAPARPVFDGDRITLQMIRFPQITFSAALTAFLEARYETDAEKNRFAAPVEVDETLEGFVRGMIPDFANRMNANTEPALRKWVLESRLDGFTRMAVNVDKSDAAKMAILRELKTASMGAAMNLPRLAGLA